MTDTHTTTDPSTATILDTLNAYTGINIWGDIINRYDIDEHRTIAHETTTANDVFVLADGRRFRYIAQDERWIVETDGNPYEGAALVLGAAYDLALAVPPTLDGWVPVNSHELETVTRNLAASAHLFGSDNGAPVELGHYAAALRRDVRRLVDSAAWLLNKPSDDVHLAITRDAAALAATATGRLVDLLDSVPRPIDPYNPNVNPYTGTGHGIYLAARATRLNSIELLRQAVGWAEHVFEPSGVPATAAYMERIIDIAAWLGDGEQSPGLASIEASALTGLIAATQDLCMIHERQS